MTTPKKYTKKPVEIEAMQLIGAAGGTFLAVCEWMNKNNYPWLEGDVLDPDSLRIPGEKWRPIRGIWISPNDGALMIRTLEGDLKASYGDYIIKGIKGEFYPCKPDIFEKSYDEVPDLHEGWEDAMKYIEGVKKGSQLN